MGHGKNKIDLSSLFYVSNEHDNTAEICAAVVNAAVAMLQSRKEFFKPREKKVNRNAAKLWWTNGYKNWDDSQFKHRLRVSRETFEFMLQRIEIYIVKEPTNIVPFPIEPHRQLGITLYRYAHGCTFSTVTDLFGLSMSLAEHVFASVSNECVMRKNSQHRGRMETRSNCLH